MAEKSLKLLIAGDSFAAKWPTKGLSWVDLLSRHYIVTNIAQAGVGEYKILKQIQSVDLKEFDCIIVNHTSPSRVHTPHHPVHREGFHKDCDLIITDLLEHNSFFNKSLRTAKDWFEYHYDDDYQITVYNLIRKEINDLINIPYIATGHLKIITQLSIEKNYVDFSNFWALEKGDINHYNEFGNRYVYKKINKKLWEIN
jgi:hypothetical protein